MEYVMFRNYLFNFIYLSIFLCCSVSVVLADEAEVNTTNASGGNQIIVSPMNVLLDLGESGYANALVLDEDAQGFGRGRWNIKGRVDRGIFYRHNIRRSVDQ